MADLEKLIIDLKESLERQNVSLKGSLEGRIANLKESLEGQFANLARRDELLNLEHLVIDVKESLERQIGGVDARVTGLDLRMREGFAEIKTRFDTQATRLDRHAGLWQAGTRWSSRIDAWAEKIDSALEVKDREIADLRERLRKLENGTKG